MRRIVFNSGFLACILAFTLPVQPANGANGQRPLAPTGLTVTPKPAVTGLALGGPIGVMNDEQRASYQAALRGMHREVAALDIKLRAARQDVLNATLTSKFDENVVREKALVVAQIEAELAVIRARAFSQVQPPLSAEQIEKIKRGQPRSMRPLERPPRREVPDTKQDPNGLPPKH
jgi:hypothetical protein